MTINKDYLKVLRDRAKESKVYRKHQLVGLEIAEVLQDAKHKALYIKLAKERDGGNLLALAKEIAEKKTIRNRGAYFMSCLHATTAPKIKSPRPKKKK